MQLLKPTFFLSNIELPGSTAIQAGKDVTKAGVKAGTNALFSDIGGFFKKNWMPLLFGGLALGGGAMAMFGGKKDKQPVGTVGAQTFSGPGGIPATQGNWQTYNPQVYNKQ